MLVENQLIEISWCNKSKDHYIKRGYKFTQSKSKFMVNCNDLLKNSTKNVQVICDYCGRIYNVQYDNYCKSIEKYPKDACCYCERNQTLESRQNEHYVKILEFCNKKGYQLLTQKKEIINTQSEVKYICSTHGEYITKVTSILQGKSCYKCSRHTALIKKNETTLKNRQNNLYEKAIHACNEKGYLLITPKNDIDSIYTYVKYNCQNFNHGIQEMRIGNLISGKGCPKCAIDKNKALYQLSIDEVEERINSLGGIILNKIDYINITEKNLKIKCPECNNVFITSLRNFTQHGGQVCSDCFGKESNGERKIRHYLEDNNITFVQEKWFKDCRDINPLPFDFYLPSKNSIVEFDGAQHFRDNNHFSYELSKVQEHDKIKTNYCKDNKIKLIRIPFWKYNNIENILSEQLYSHEDIV